MNSYGYSKHLIDRTVQFLIFYYIIVWSVCCLLNYLAWSKLWF